MNTLSKSWTMTGWRLGWLIVPSRVVADFGKMVELNTSCAPPFVQRVGIAAIRDGERLVRDTVARLARSRDLLVERLRALPGVKAAALLGAMYLFFRIARRSDGRLSFAKELVVRSGLGFAPGIALGAQGEGHLCWCFAATESLIEQGVARLVRHLR